MLQMGPPPKKEKKNRNTRKSSFSKTVSLVMGSVLLAAQSSPLSDCPINPASKLAAVRLPCRVPLIDDHLWELTWHTVSAFQTAALTFWIVLLLSIPKHYSVVRLCLLLPELWNPSVTRGVTCGEQTPTLNRPGQGTNNPTPKDVPCLTE